MPDEHTSQKDVQVICSSCQRPVSEYETYLLRPGVSVCFDCISNGNFSGRIFFDVVYLIKLRLKQSTDALKKRVVRKNNEVGWYHYLDEKKIGISSSAYAVGLLSRTSPTYPDLRTAADTVLKRFVEDSTGTTPVGGWPMASIPDVILAEPTCYCLYQLFESGYLGLNSPEAIKAAHWLVSQQKEDSSWGPRKEIRAFIYVTSLVIHTLAVLQAREPLELDFVAKPLKDAITWLCEANNPTDGGWGREFKDGNSDPWDTAHALLALLSVGNENSRNLVERGISYLIENPNQWSNTLTMVYEVNGRRATYIFHPKPIVLTTLLRSGLSPYLPVMLRAIFEIVKAQDPNTGLWRYPGDARGTIFELCHNATCLMEFISRASSMGSMLEIHHSVNKVEQAVNEIETKLVKIDNQVRATHSSIMETNKLQKKMNYSDQLNDMNRHIKIIYILLIQGVYWYLVLNYPIPQNYLIPPLSVAGQIFISVIITLMIIAFWHKTKGSLQKFLKYTIITALLITAGVILYGAYSQLINLGFTVLVAAVQLLVSILFKNQKSKAN